MKLDMNETICVCGARAYTRVCANMINKKAYLKLPYMNNSNEEILIC